MYCRQAGEKAIAREAVESFEQALCLSRLWPQPGKRAETRELLQPVFHWFTEGFDTADLQDDKALLEALEQ